MSSMRNAVQRRNHKERSQPQERAKWGLLEKHKDYSLRAKDYNLKKARLKALREKAALANPDEFSYKMLSSRTDAAGRKITERGNKTLSQDVVLLLKTQDAGYLRTKAQVEKLRQERLRESWTFGEDGELRDLTGVGEGKHTRYVDMHDEDRPHPLFLAQIQRDRQRILDQVQWSDEVASESTLAASPDPPPPPEPVRTEEVAAIDQELHKIRKKTRSDMARLLEISRLREKELKTAERELQIQRAMMGKSVTVSGKNKAGVAWRARERKR